jgi:hypothetical protein
MASVSIWLEMVAPLITSISTGAFAGTPTSDCANAGLENALRLMPSRF